MHCQRTNRLSLLFKHIVCKAYDRYADNDQEEKPDEFISFQDG